VVQIHTYIYDGSFGGFLQAAWQAKEEQMESVNIVNQEIYRPLLFGGITKVNTNPQLVEDISQIVKDNISISVSKILYKAFLSEQPGIELFLYNYLSKGLVKGAKIEENLADDDIRIVHAAAHKVMKENHRVKGLLRFQETKSKFYYSRLEPDHRILVLLAPHFKRRLSQQNWIIHDKKRAEAVVYSREQKKWILTTLEADFEPTLSDRELKMQKLWKTFFKNISIAERRNKKLQKQYMPTRYWKNLIETPQ